MIRERIKFWGCFFKLLSDEIKCLRSFWELSRDEIGVRMDEVTEDTGAHGKRERRYGSQTVVHERGGAGALER